MLLLTLTLACAAPNCSAPSGADSAPIEDADSDSAQGTADGPSCHPAQRPFPQRLSYPGAASHLSGEPDAHEAALLRFYEGWVERYLVEAAPAADGAPRYRVRMGSDSDSPTVSEGQGFGMVLVATMAGADPSAQERFDGLWRFSRDHPSDRDARLMDWYVPTDEADGGGSDNSAFDGDADIALGLLLARAQWGEGCAVDYGAAAAEVLAGLEASAVGADSRLPLLGDWVPVWDDDYDEWDLRTSDVMPASFAAFAAVDPAWEEIRVASLSASAEIAAQLAPETGLLPDFALDGGDGRWSAEPDYLEAETDDDWSYNAVRAPWRLGFAALALDDLEAAALAGPMSRWAEAEVLGDPERLRAGYRLDGGRLSGAGYFHPLFAATLGPAAMTTPGAQAWVDAIWGAVSAEHVDYYSDTVTLMAMLVMTESAWLPE